MKYSRTTLRATALDVRKMWVDSIKAHDAKKEAEYKKHLARWQTVDKPLVLAKLAEWTSLTKKGQGFNAYGRDIPQPPSKPEPLHDITCHTSIRALDELVVLLDTMADEDITSTALSLAGVKDLSRVLRRPC